MFFEASRQERHSKFFLKFVAQSDLYAGSRVDDPKERVPNTPASGPSQISFMIRNQRSFREDGAEMLQNHLTFYSNQSSTDMNEFKYSNILPLQKQLSFCGSPYMVPNTLDNVSIKYDPLQDDKLFSQQQVNNYPKFHQSEMFDLISKLNQQQDSKKDFQSEKKITRQQIMQLMNDHFHLLSKIEPSQSIHGDQKIILPIPSDFFRKMQSSDQIVLQDIARMSTNPTSN